MYFDKKICATMRERKQLDFVLNVKSLSNHGHFSGYASVFNIVDNQHDVILPGAFAGSIHRGVTHIKFLWQHQQDEPIGVITSIREDNHGLYVQGRLLLEVTRAQEAYALLKEGAISGLSIGYSPIHYHIDPETGVRQLTEVELWEISLVTFPANTDANVTMLKTDQPESVDPAWLQAQRSEQLIALSDAFDKATAVLKG